MVVTNEQSPHTVTSYADITIAERESTIRCIKELEDLGLIYDSNSSELKCIACHDATNTTILTIDQGVFVYPNELEHDFKDKKYRMGEFTNLKKSVKRHLTHSVTHQKK